MKKMKIKEGWGRSVFSTYINCSGEGDDGINCYSATPVRDARTYVHFKKQDVFAVIKQDVWCIELYDGNEEYMTCHSIPSVKEGREAYLDVYCGCVEDEIIIKLPVYQWIDHYPHCDGENDRWEGRATDFYTLAYNLTNGEWRVDF